MTLFDRVLIIDRDLSSMIAARFMSKEDFIKTVGDEDIYNTLHNSKCGYINIKRDSDGVGIDGVTADFGEGLGLYAANIDRWRTTSKINKIDWENNKFYTQNSVYSFTFKELSKDEYNSLNSEYNESKSSE